MAMVHVIPNKALGLGKGFTVLEFSKTGLWKSSVFCADKTTAVNTAIAVRTRIRKEGKKRG